MRDRARLTALRETRWRPPHPCAGPITPRQGFRFKNSETTEGVSLDICEDGRNCAKLFPCTLPHPNLCLSVRTAKAACGAARACLCPWAQPPKLNAVLLNRRLTASIPRTRSAASSSSRASASRAGASHRCPPCPFHVALPSQSASCPTSPSGQLQDKVRQHRVHLCAREPGRAQRARGEA